MWNTLSIVISLSHLYNGLLLFSETSGVTFDSDLDKTKKAKSAKSDAEEFKRPLKKRPLAGEKLKFEYVAECALSMLMKTFSAIF